MRRTTIFTLLILSLSAATWAQDSPREASTITVPSGTKILLSLKSAVSSVTAKPGDAIYLETGFPVVQDGVMVIPGGTYVKGIVDSAKRSGRMKGRAEILLHFTTLIYSNGYSVPLPGSMNDAPGLEDGKVKGKEGTIQANGQKGKDAGKIASNAAEGALIGGLASRGIGGAGIGGGVGAAVGLATVLFGRGPEVRFPAGTPLEMVLQRALVLDAGRLPTSSLRSENNSLPRDPNAPKPERRVLSPDPISR